MQNERPVRFPFLFLAQLAAIAMTGASFLASAADPETYAERFPGYKPAHTVIKCPYLPADLLEVPTCHGKRATCVGTPGRDLILGSEADDVIVAGDGDDVVHGDLGHDIICGGEGNDSLFGAKGNDVIYGGPGDDWLFGAVGVDELYGGPGDDVLWGGPGQDKLYGGEGEHDVCMLQREMGEADASCETIYPPPGYDHDQDPEPGVLKFGKPR
jgi:hypothetical protein